jgi:hypothetical protein
MDLMELFKRFRQRQGMEGAQNAMRPDLMRPQDQAAYAQAMGGQGVQGGPPGGGMPPGAGGGMPPGAGGPPQGAIGQAAGAPPGGGGDVMQIMQKLMAQGMPQEQAMMRAYQMASQ